MTEASRPHVVVLCSPNQSRLAHLRKMSTLRDQYEITLCRIGTGIGWEGTFVENVVEVPLSGAGIVPEAVAKQLEEIRVPNAIINLSEAYVPLHAQLCHYFGVMGPTEEAAQIGRNKLRMREFCSRLEIPVPGFALVTPCDTSAAEGLAYPVVIKPAIGCSSSLVERLETYDELEARIADIGAAAMKLYAGELLLHQCLEEYGAFPFVVEEVIPGDIQFSSMLPYHVGEISVESICHEGTVTVLAIHDAPVPANGPFFEKVVNSTPTRVPLMLVDEATEFVRRIHKGLGSGAYVLHSEMRTLQHGVGLLEFGIRLGGSSIYRSVLHSTGNDFIEILIELALQHRPTLHSYDPLPTITHYLTPRVSGRVTDIAGVEHIVSSPYYVDHELYDGIGDLVRRPPLRSRASGYFALRGASFDLLEVETLRLLRAVDIQVEPF